MMNSGFVSKDLVLWPYNNHEQVADVDFDDNGVLRMTAEKLVSSPLCDAMALFHETGDEEALNTQLEAMLLGRE